MASALSPTAVASSEDRQGPVTTRDFAELVKYYQVTHKAIVRLTGILHRLPSNQPLVIGKHTIRRSDVSKYSQAYVSQLGDLRKIFNSKRRSKGTRKTNSQLNSLFYVSDQLVAFYKKDANLGPLDPSQKKSDPLSHHIDILTDKHMATSGILTSLISRYIEANSLKTPEASGRFMPDERMKKAFANTKYQLFGENLAKRSIATGTPQEKVDKIKENISQGSKSAFSRVSGRVDRRSGKSVYDKDTGLLYTTMMVFNNFYRVPPSLLTDEEKEALQDEDNIAAARELQTSLSNITKWSHSNK